MKEAEQGIILNIVSPIDQLQEVINHAADEVSRTGLIGLTQAAGRELTAYNIRTNALILEPDTEDKENAIKQALYLCSDSAADVIEQVVKANLI
jgi:NAD(P)-dependent dehydrogenase (short-subunit alcohol dehydrogenase family)